VSAKATGIYDTQAVNVSKAKSISIFFIRM